MKKKGKWGKGLGRLFAGPDESARMPSERSRSKAEPGSDADEIETPEDILAKYGKYLDEDGVPFKGINPKPKYYVVPKEQPLEAVPVEEPLEPAPPIVHQIKTTPTPPPKPEPEPRKVIVRKRTPKKVVVRKRARPEPPVPKAKKIVVKKAAKPLKVKIKVKR
ncbi:MAG: hypothetical protein UHM52_03210 [Acutalibacteraceae bacterium]|nr:hypothetical protein [Acutalibacteraceae bacterium]